MKPQVKVICDGVEILNNHENDSDKMEGSERDGLVSMKKLFKYFINLRKIYCCNNNLYFYNEELGYLQRIPEGEEALYIRKNIDFDIGCNLSSRHVEELIRRLKSEPEINIKYEEFNSNPYLINCKNGVVDVVNNKLFHHDVNYKFTYCIDANYSESEIKYGKETTKFFKTSLENNEDKIRLLLEVIGYLISDFNNAKKAFIFLGKPHSGKSLLTKIISNLIGCENVSNIPFHKLGERFSIGELSNHKLNINAELDSSPISKISNFKAIVGNDFLSGEFKGKPLFSFKSKTKLLFCGNYMPEVKDIESTQAFTDRLIFLIFNRSTPKEELDYELEEKLMNEIDLLFTESIFALKNLINNNFKFTIPNDSMAYLKEYTNRQNHISEFISECCYLSDQHRVYTKDLYKWYLNFCEENCINSYNFNKFNAYIANCDGIIRARFRCNGSNKRGFEGIGIKDFLCVGTEQ